MAANKFLLGEFEQDVAGRYAIFLLSAFGEQEERAVNTSVAQGQSVAVDADGEIHHGHNQVFGHILDFEHIHTRFDAVTGTNSNKHFHRCVARARAQTSAGRVNARGATFNGLQRVGNAHGQIVVAVKAQFGSRLQGLAHGIQTHFDIFGQHIASRVGDINAVGAIAFHQLGLFYQAFRRVHVRHHQEADGVHVEFACHIDVLFRHIGLGAVRGHTDGVHAQLFGLEQVLNGADARQQQRGYLGFFHQRNDGAQVFFIAVRRKTVVERGAAQAVAMGHFNQWHAGVVQTTGDGFHVVQADLVLLGVHAIAQGHVMQGDFFAFEIH